jgi:hypothetical protein
MDSGDLGTLLLLMAVVLILIALFELFVVSIIESVFKLFKFLVRFGTIFFLIFIIISYIWPTVDILNCQIIVSENLLGKNVIRPEKIMLTANPIRGIIGADRAFVLFTYFLSKTANHSCQVFVVNNSNLGVSNFIHGFYYIFAIITPPIITNGIKIVNSFINYFPKKNGS